MTYEEFVSYVRENIANILGDDNCVSIRKVLKNNDIELDALTVLNVKSNISPTIYLNSYYDEYVEGREEYEIVSEIYELYEEHKNSINFDVDIFKSFSSIKDKVAYKLINYEANGKLLQDVPHVKMLDLAIVFYCMLDNDYLGSATALIHNIHIEMWNISVDQLYEAAKVNTPKILEYDLREMSEVIRSILIDDIQQTLFESDNRYEINTKLPSAEVVADGLIKNITESEGSIDMYVLTNKLKTNGAACMLYDGVLHSFAESLNKDLYILPSSVHEVIIVPKYDRIKKDELSMMVEEVNSEELDAIDILSDHVYFYSKDDDKISM